LYLEVYPDVIFILNFYLDLIILSLLKKINRKNSSLIRRIIAAIFGGAVAVVVGIMPWIDTIIRFVILNIVTALLMLMLAFGRMKRWDMMKQMISLYLLTYTFGGFLNSIYFYTGLREHAIMLGQTKIADDVSIGTIVYSVTFLLPVIILCVYLFGWMSKDKQELLRIELYQGEHKISSVGLIDSGNNLCDPIFNKPVIIVEKSLMRGLITTSYYEQIDGIIGMMEGSASGAEITALDPSEHMKLRMIPYQSIGKKQGVMPGLVIDKLLIYKEKEIICNEHVTVAICENRLSAKDQYHVILHRELL